MQELNLNNIVPMFIGAAIVLISILLTQNHSRDCECDETGDDDDENSFTVTLLAIDSDGRQFHTTSCFIGLPETGQRMLLTSVNSDGAIGDGIEAIASEIYLLSDENEQRASHLIKFLVTTKDSRELQELGWTAV